MIIIMSIILERMKDSAQSKGGADQRNQFNEWTKTSHDQFKIFTGDLSHSKSFDKTYNVSLFCI